MCYVQTRAKSGKNIGGQLAHDFRRKKPSYILQESYVELMIYAEWELGSRQWYRIYGDNDPEIKRLQHYMKCEMKERIARQKEAYQEEHGKRMPYNSNHFFKGVVTFSHEDINGNRTNNKNRNGLDLSMDKFLEYLFDHYGVLPLYFVRHEDETTVHYHYVCENFNYEDKRTVLRRLQNEEFSRLQDIVGEAFKSEGYVRGESKEKTNAEHVHFTEHEREEIVKANRLATQTAKILENTSKDIEGLQEALKQATNGILEIDKKIIDKENEIDETKLQLTLSKEARKSFIQMHHRDTMNEDDVKKLRKIEEASRAVRDQMKILKEELQLLKNERNGAVNEIESKKEEIQEIINSSEEKLSKSRKNRKK